LETKVFFENSLKPENIIRSLEYKAGFKIKPEKAFGSLLGVVIHKGDLLHICKVDRLEFFPMNFACTWSNALPANCAR
jgi:hypothetical protein